MKPKINDVIIVKREDWIEIQELLIEIGYIWCSNKRVTVRFPYEKNLIKIYILIEQNHMGGEKLMLSHSHISCAVISFEDTEFHDAKAIINYYKREKKLKRILQ